MGLKVLWDYRSGPIKYGTISLGLKIWAYKSFFRSGWFGWKKEAREEYIEEGRKGGIDEGRMTEIEE